MASYPGSVVEFSTKTNLVDTIVADHVNRLQEEVVAVQGSLGTTLLSSAYSGTFSATTSWSNLGLRLLNIEAGLVNGVGNAPYVRKDSGNTLNAPAGSTAVVINSASGNTADLVTTKNSAGANKFRVDYLGEPKVGTANIYYEGSAASAAFKADILNEASTAGVGINPLMLIG